MMNEMFCFQCEQTANGTGCTKGGVCGKHISTAHMQDELTGALISLALSRKGIQPDATTNRAVLEALFMTVTNVNFTDSVLQQQKEMICALSGDTKIFDMNALWTAKEDIRSLKSLILFGIRGMAAYAYHALLLGYTSEAVQAFLYTALRSLASDMSLENLISLVMETGKVNLQCMELLDKAHTETFGNPTAVSVSLDIEKGPFIVVSGHDLDDMEMLLKQSEGLGISVYTHGEMLPAHGYPKLKSYAHLKGHFGTAWQNQQKEFIDIPAPVLFTTNCIMPPKDNYIDRLFTTAVVSYPEITHIDYVGVGNKSKKTKGIYKKDFSPLIEKARALGGYADTQYAHGINGGHTVTTGFAHVAVGAQLGKIIEAVKAGKITHFFLVGGCDGAKPGRNYYTDFVKNTAPDTVVFTLACGKYRFNDLDLGTIDGLPRLMDIGQCNDAYSAVRIVLALADAFKCSVNDLPLSVVLSWYEQKAVCVLLTLLSLGIKNIRLGPTMPAFISPTVLQYLRDHFNIAPITRAEDDLAHMLS